MAIFHLSAKIIRRSQGSSAITKAAYNAREALHDERTGELKDYRRAEGLIFSGIYTPTNAPEWAKDREQLWNAAEAAEKRKDAQLAREYEIALPHELTDEQRRFLVQDFVRENFTRKGYAADVCIHAPDRKGDNRNHHAHILITDRRLEESGFARDKKDRQQTDTERKNELEALREKWERTANRHLERHGHEARIDRRSLKAQGIDREPTAHLGPAAHAMERKGQRTERGDLNREIQSTNRARERLHAHGEQIERQTKRARQMTLFPEESPIRDAQQRYQQALQSYDPQDPYGSLARSAETEYALWKREQDDLDQRIAQTHDPNARHALELRQQIEGLDYLALTSERIAQQSVVITGDRHNAEAVQRRSQAKDYRQQAQTLRQEWQQEHLQREPATPETHPHEAETVLRVREQGGEPVPLAAFLQTTPEPTPKARTVRPEVMERIATRKRNEGLDSIARALKADRPLAADDVRKLKPEDREGLRQHGDAHLRDLVQAREAERRRDDDRGRERER